ncbi:DEAD/DEAH box helicase [Actinotignum urinale]|uniref:DEAD/DEAH box helicase n=1 Tax=Actinotignum urinale TaxID=190146 RepID=A0ABU5G7J5_9ACTO|nr:DEAD/DEAH box helicase [Actinotignum urinale]MDY5133059.1 DEAD/DEAH box helicase [Actinotignum urinale]
MSLHTTPNTALYRENPDTARYRENPDTARYRENPDRALCRENQDTALYRDYRDSYASRGIILDEFQRQGCLALERADVLVSAPTGSGKTVVAMYAVYLALAQGKRCVYTAPIKALSNQKYNELVRDIGEENVGLLTGDQSINREAQILVVTTEVLRNMILHASEDLVDIGYAVLDEVHFLADRERGPVWEETIMSLPSHIRLVSLSATIANLEELTEWMRSIRGATEVVVSTVRPVPLSHFASVRRKMYPLFTPVPSADPKEKEVNPRLIHALNQLDDHQDGRRKTTGRDRRKIIHQLAENDMLPAIVFIFSRAGCDKAVDMLLDSGEVLTNAEQRRKIREELGTLREKLSPSDRRAIRFERAAKALERGFGAHHAGVFPALKEITEKLMERGLISIVYATGTLALGIDMPVRTVVLEDLRRWNGQGFVDIGATEYTQLMGRAGRRGKDIEGYGIVLTSPETDPEHLADVASGRVDPLISAFQPSYNTVVNLRARMSNQDARGLMGRSFAQFQRQADVAKLEVRIQKIHGRLAQEKERLHCNLGDISDYLSQLAQGGRAAKSARKAAKREYRERIEDSFATARNGRIYAYTVEKELVYGLVLSRDGQRLRIIDMFSDMYWLYEDELSSELRAVGELELPRGLSLKRREVREDIAQSLMDAVEDRIDVGLDEDLLRSWSRFAPPRDTALLRHPCASCPDMDSHIRQGESVMSLAKNLQDLEARVAGFTDSVGREFDATVSILTQLGVLQGEDTHLSVGAEQLRHLHMEGDLLAYLCLSRLEENSLEPHDLAGWASIFLCDDRLGTAFPRTAVLFDAASVARHEANFLRSLELRAGIERTPEPSPGCADAMRAWAQGSGLETCLAMSRMVAGDFITAARRVVDVLGQIALAMEGTWLESVARDAGRLMRRTDFL